MTVGWLSVNPHNAIESQEIHETEFRVPPKSEFGGDCTKTGTHRSKDKYVGELVDRVIILTSISDEGVFVVRCWEVAEDVAKDFVWEAEDPWLQGRWRDSVRGLRMELESTLARPRRLPAGDWLVAIRREVAFQRFRPHVLAEDFKRNQTAREYSDKTVNYLC